MTQRSKFADSNAQDYIANQFEIKLKIKEQMNAQGLTMLPDKKSLYFSLDYWPPKGKQHKGDLDNILKAVVDALQGVVFSNDAWIDVHNATRFPVDPGGPRVKITVGVNR
jgi:Holliday junction resolvase RusA-like endonuclease